MKLTRDQKHAWRFRRAKLEEETTTMESEEMELRPFIEDCLRANTKDGLPWQRLTNVENCFW